MVKAGGGFFYKKYTINTSVDITCILAQIYSKINIQSHLQNFFEKGEVSIPDGKYHQCYLGGKGGTRGEKKGRK